MNQTVYKYNEDECRMIEVGILTEDNNVVFKQPIYQTLQKLDVSLYDRRFYIENIKPYVLKGYNAVTPNNLSELQEISTGAEGQSYVLGYISEGKLICYDQHLG